MRYFLLLLVLLGCGRVAFAQAAPPPQPEVLQASPATDTAAAIHRLFAHKRKRNRFFVFGAAGLVATGGVVIGTAAPQFISNDQTEVGICLVTAGLVVLISEAIVGHDYNKKSEQRAIEDLQTHNLSRQVKRQLKLTYFQ